ncbi:MAG TPA: branched-chain amino acid ABC transporter substrate-binding protein [Burkholderiales bacterium]|jgi:branched-chain amino acid transport system substrate-binding protein|nr:branched-chain amino acid ABC transporter substrate-binding protein [Burkholderiales bacterium]
MDIERHGVTRRVLAAVCSVAVAAVLGACGKKEEQPATTDGTTSALERVVKIGHAGPLTGPIAHLGKDNENGVRLAIEEANAAGLVIGGEKIRFELISEDDEANPQKGTVVAQKLVDAKVAGVIGHLNSGTTIPASKIYHDAGIPQISPSATNVDYTHQGFKTAFRVMANDAQQGKVLGEYAVKKLGAKKIAVIDDRSAYGKGLADQFEAAAKTAGAQIITREFTDTTKTDFTAILTSIKGKRPDLIFYGGMDSQAGPMMKQIKNLGVRAIYLAGDGVQTTQFLTLAGPEGESAYASSPGVPLDKMPGGKEFAEKYQKRFNQPIQLYAPYAYDAMNAMIEAMKAADSVDPAKYLPALASIQYQGVTGLVQFDEKGDIKGGSISLYQVKNNKWEYLETVG